MSPRPKLCVIGAGGTIAGVGVSATAAAYKPGRIDTADLLAGVGAIGHLAEVSTETLYSTGSEDLGPQQWLALARRVHAVAKQSDVQGIVITHGTDTLEEAAFFLDLVCRTEQPIVMTGAMRPTTALSADGPANIHQAILAAVDPRLRNGGVTVAMDGLLLPGWQVTKTNSVALGTFDAYPGGPLGRFVGERLCVFQEIRRPPLAGAFHPLLHRDEDLPDVGVVFVHGGCADAALSVWRGSPFRGLVIAGFGAGTMPAALAAAAREMLGNGMVIIVSSRVGEVVVQTDTLTGRGRDGLLASGFLNPGKSAVLLSLALASSLSARDVGRLLDRINGVASLSRESK